MNRFNIDLINDKQREDALFLIQTYTKRNDGFRALCYELAMALDEHSNLQRKICELRRKLRIQTEEDLKDAPKSKLSKKLQKMYPVGLQPLADKFNSERG